MKSSHVLAILCFFTQQVLAVKPPSDFAVADKNGDGLVDRTEWDAYKLSMAGPGAALAPEDPDPWGDKKGKSDPTAPSRKEGVMTEFIKDHFSIKKSFLSGVDKDATSPAKVTWTHAKGQKNYYNLDFAVSSDWTQLDSEMFHPGGWAVGDYRFAYTLDPVFEAHVSTEPKQSQNKLTYQLAIDLLLVPEDTKAKIKGWDLYLTPGYETDRNKLTRTWKSEALLTYSVPSIGLGAPVTILPHVDFYWRPFVGCEFAHDTEKSRTQEDGTLSESKDDSYGWWKAHMLGQFTFWETLAVTGDYVYRGELYGNHGSHGYLELAASIFLDPAKHYTAGVSYTRGEDSPDFEDINKYEGWIGLDF